MEPTAETTDPRTRAWRPRDVALGAMVAAGAISTVLYVLLGAIAAYEDRLQHDDLVGIALWTIAPLVGLGATIHVWRRRPDHPLLLAFAVVAPLNTVGLLLNALPSMVPAATTDPWIAMASVTGANLVNTVSAIAFVRIAATFPDGRFLRRIERAAVRWSWLLLVQVVVLAVLVPRVPFPEWLGLPALANPWTLGFTVDQEVGLALQDVAFLVPLPAAVLLATRYRVLAQQERRRTRWILVPVVLSAFAILGEMLWSAVIGNEPFGIALAIVPATLYVGLALGLVGHAAADADRALRRSVVYGALWTAIAGVYVAVSAAVGVAAGTRLPVEWAIVLTIVTAMVFQPARAWLENVVDRWVFGRRADPTRMVARLGEALSGGLDLDTVLPRMSATLEEGLGLEWASVRVDTDAAGVPVGGATHEGASPSGDGDGDPGPPAAAMLIVPIEHRGRVVGVVECGPKRSGAFTDEDRAVVATLARQAALAVGNVRLARELVVRADQLADSRSRLVRAQQLERRRIERDIHDGVQQEIVGLMAYVGALRQVDGSGGQELEAVQAGLTRLLGDIRELAAGIHPSTLTDLGLLASVETLANRSAVPTTVRADGPLGVGDLPEEVAGVAYFTIAEALANAAKHASATDVEVVLARTVDTLLIDVSDDGVGFHARDTDAGQGLSNLTERIEAIDGTLTVTSVEGAGTVVTASIPVAAVVPSGDVR